MMLGERVYLRPIVKDDLPHLINGEKMRILSVFSEADSCPYQWICRHDGWIR